MGEKRKKWELWVARLLLSCYETLIRQALDAPIHFLLRRPSRRQNRRSYKRTFLMNMIMCIRHCNPHVTHHVQSSRDSRLSRFTKCLSPSLSHPLSLYVRSFHTLHSHAAQLHSLHSCTVSVVDCALSTVRSNAQSAVVYVLMRLVPAIHERETKS